MKHLIIILAFLLTACTTTEPHPKHPLAGSWRGLYFDTQGTSEKITAQVRHNNQTIEITTRINDQPRAFIGTLDPTNHLHMLDRKTGAKWTSSFGPVSPHNIKITRESPDDVPTQFIDLNR